jgi:hypothetical protein
MRAPSRQRKISTFHADKNRGYAEVWMDFKEEVAFIKYFDDNNVKFFEEDYPDKAVSYVEDAAENWALGIKTLEGNFQGALI